MGLAATYLHIAQFNNENCTKLTSAYVGMASAARGAFGFVAGNNDPIYANCPLNAAPGTLITVYSDSNDEFYANVTLNQCALGQVVAGSTPPVYSYVATCSQSSFPPVATLKIFTFTSYANQTTCESKINWAKRIMYPSGECAVYNGGSQKYAPVTSGAADVLH